MSDEYRNRRNALVNTARETKAALPGILRDLPHVQADYSEIFVGPSLQRLDALKCPKFKLVSKPQSCGTAVRVFNEDTFNAALNMLTTVPDQETPPGVTESNKRVMVLNLASDKNPGGGWLSGATAQEEALCYRSSLSLSLHKAYYPWSELTALYTRDVVIIRGSMGDGHKLLQVPHNELPVVSVASVAGIRRPAVRRKPGEHPVFKNIEDRNLTKEKMRMTLRMAAHKHHELLVLGAIGCGAFRNPPEDVAACWREVLEEEEFRGGWWREIWFAVFDRKNEGNFEIFRDTFDGKDFGVVAQEAKSAAPSDA